MGSTSEANGELKIGEHTIQVTSLDKVLYPEKDITKQAYLQYLIEVHKRMLPFLSDRFLTVKRYPHGMYDDFFYQKNCPDYAPEFVQTKSDDKINYIVCNELATLLWLGNQLALEFHIPFNTIDSPFPTEIVFDLDPPSRNHFHLAVKAAIEIKKILDRLELKGFVKTSGNKGLQIYIPLQRDTFSYDDTRVFTKFIAEYLVNQFPGDFTIERLKENRGSKCYIDFLQHAEGKTIIAPYSLRGVDEALVATPLYWHEVDEKVRPERYSMHDVLERIKQVGCPFSEMETARNKQPFRRVLEGLLRQ
ncbi:non-homologous end-joining DNA ligase [Pseudalkalibacillus sp. SCS-8]|uniref:non-homologous end-joining DNA ligase n=1 Tax=Pseudalkalibacillus nanhaiensis TaxID=3115291 RepID=UPI0032DB5CA1